MLVLLLVLSFSCGLYAECTCVSGKDFILTMTSIRTSSGSAAIIVIPISSSLKRNVTVVLKFWYNRNKIEGTSENCDWRNTRRHKFQYKDLLLSVVIPLLEGIHGKYGQDKVMVGVMQGNGEGWK